MENSPRLKHIINSPINPCVKYSSGILLITVCISALLIYLYKDELMVKYPILYQLFQ